MPEPQFVKNKKAGRTILQCDRQQGAKINNLIQPSGTPSVHGQSQVYRFAHDSSLQQSSQPVTMSSHNPPLLPLHAEFEVHNNFQSDFLSNSSGLNSNG